MMSQLLAQLAGNQLVGFILVLARVTPLFFLAPMFSSAMIPARVRGIVAVALAMGLAPMALHGQHVPSEPVALAGLVAEGLLVGFGFAFALGALFAAVETAGALTDVLAGFSFGALIDPVSGNEGGVLTEFYSLVGTMIFLTIGGDAWVLKGLARTFQLVPLTSAPQISSLVAGAVNVFTGVLGAALEVAAPVVIALLITDVAFGVVSRVVPQLSVFAVGFPAKVVVALLVVGATMPFVGGWLSQQISVSVGAAFSALHVA
jgi:flagellar biosynthetic protein FliR